MKRKDDKGRIKVPKSFVELQNVVEDEELGFRWGSAHRRSRGTASRPR